MLHKSSKLSENVHYAVTCHEYFIMQLNVRICLKMSEYAGKCQKCRNRIENVRLCWESDRKCRIIQKVYKLSENTRT